MRREIRTRTVPIALMVLGLAGCAPAPAPVASGPPLPTSGGTAQSHAQAAVLAQDPRIRRIADMLQKRGFALSALDLSAVEMLSDAPGVVYRLGDREWVHLHAYPTAAAATAAAQRLSTEQPRVIIDWVAEPNFFRCDQTIVMYAGVRAEVLKALTDGCGPEFATRV